MKHHPDRNPDDPDVRAQVQGGQGGLRGAHRRAESARCTISSAMPDSRAAAAADSAPGRRSATFSARCSAISSPAASAAARRCFAARICATSSNSISSRRCSAPTPRSRFPPSPSARPARARAPPRVRPPRPAIPATARARCACSNPFSRSSSPARAARAAARSSATRATPATARAACGRRRRSPVSVPAGVDTGDRIRLNGEGEAGRNGGPPGDLYVEMRVREHADLRARGEPSVLRGADQLHHRRARRLGGGADARRRGGAQDSERDAVRTRVSRA